jgi:hypothetical protein
MGSITTSGTLPIGVTIEGVTHRAYVLRGALVSDNIKATDELVARGENPDQLRIATALMSYQLIKLGNLVTQEAAEKTGVKPEVTVDVMRGLHIADWNHLDKESAALEKKLLCVDQTPTPAGGSTSLPGADETALTLTT